MNTKDILVSSLQKAVKEVTGINFIPQVNSDSELRNGDYTTNVAMVLFGKNQESRIPSIKLRTSKNQEWSSPVELAKKIADKSLIHASEFKILEKIEVANPGFINCWLSKNYLITSLSQVIREDEKFGMTTKMKDLKIMIEFTDPNPFKEFHVGHLYSNIVGESLARLLEFQGAQVVRANYQGDVGLHVAKALWGMQKKFKAQNSKFKTTENLEKVPLEERIKFMGDAYAQGAKAYEEDEQAKQEMNQLNKKIYEKDPSITGLYEKGREWSLEYFETIYKRLGTAFDYYYFESQVGQAGLMLVKEFLSKGIFEASEGAVIFPGERYGMHNRVFINSLGLPTYEAKELGLAPIKYQDFAYDKSIIITGSEINEYFKVLLKALSFVRPDLAEKTKHLSHGMVRLPSGKMSSRTGNVITGEWLLNETKSLLSKSYPDMKDETAEMVAIAAVKYALLKANIGSNITFDFHESINIAGNSGPYLQYAYVRTQSVLKKSSLKKDKIKALTEEDLQSNLEKDLLRLIVKFPEILEISVALYAPHLLTTYLFSLSQNFNLFYQEQKIIGSKNESLLLGITAGVGIVIRNGLQVLGIPVPDAL